MKINTTTLVHFLEIATRFIDKNPIMPILDNVLIGAKEGKMAIKATNLKGGIVIKNIECEGGLEAVGVEAYKLLGIVKAFPGDTDLTISNATDITINIECDTAKVELPVQNPEDYPKIDVSMPASPGIFDAAVLLKALHKVAPFKDNDIMKPQCDGVHISAKEGMIEVIAGGGHVMGLFKEEGSQGFVSGTIPSGMVSAVMNSMPSQGEMKMANMERQLRFQWGDISIFILKNNVDFIAHQYKAILSNPESKVVATSTVRNQDLRSPIEMIIAISDNNTNKSVPLGYVEVKDGNVLFSYKNQDKIARYEVAGEGQGHEKLMMNFQTLKNVTKLVGDMDGFVEIKTRGMKGALISDDNTDYVVMPIVDPENIIK